MTSSPKKKGWRFYRAGGLDQVRLENGADIARLAELDLKLWVALACPVKGLELDEHTLALVDTDHDGRVRASEVIAAIDFLKVRLKTLDTLLPGADHLALDALDETTPEGQATIASARRILTNLGRAEHPSIAVADIADPVLFFKDTRFNGDGVITPESADDPDTAAVVRDVVATQGSVKDRNGTDGVDASHIDAFFGEAAALREWHAKGDSDAAMQPFGRDTAAAYAATKAVQAKVDDYFVRCRLAAFDARSLKAVNRAEDDYLPVGSHDLSATAQELGGFPLAHVEAGRPLPLDSGLNPAWAEAVHRLREQAVKPAFGDRTSLTEAEWRELGSRLAAHAAWASARPATKLDALGDERVTALLASDAHAKLADLLQRDLALAAESEGIDAVVKIVRLNRDFVRLLHNFVSFGDFYSRKREATFQAGHLYLDSRECHLCIRVEDAGKHAALAGLSKCYLAYCDVMRDGGKEKMQVLAIFTQGDSDYLMTGRNGLFVDRKGQDWDATIVKIVDAPISIRQAFFAPYKKFLRMIEEQVAKRAAAADAETDAHLTAGATAVAHIDKAESGPAPAAASPAAAVAAKPEPKKIDLGTIALIGTAISGVAAMAGLVLEKFFGLGVYMPLGIVALVLLISGPSMLIAALKLHQRSLGPVLDASGWAINGRVKINIPFGTALTDLAKLPPNSQHALQDPFAEDSGAWPAIAVLVAILALAAWVAYRFDWVHGFPPHFS